MALEDDGILFRKVLHRFLQNLMEWNMGVIDVVRDSWIVKFKPWSFHLLFHSHLPTLTESSVREARGPIGGT